MLHATSGVGPMKVKLSDVREYLLSVDMQMVRPADIRDVFNLNSKEYHCLRTSLKRWARQGKIDNPSRGWYRAVPQFGKFEDIFQGVPPEHVKFHNIQLSGKYPKNSKIKGWGAIATFQRSGTYNLPLSWGGNCKIIKHGNGRIQFQSNNSTDPYTVPQALQFIGWLEGAILPFHFYDLDLRIKQIDVHIDNAKIQLAPATALRIEWFGELLWQIYDKKPLGATRIEVPAKVNLTPGEFIDILLHVRKIGGESTDSKGVKD